MRSRTLRVRTEGHDRAHSHAAHTGANLVGTTVTQGGSWPWPPAGARDSEDAWRDRRCCAPMLRHTTVFAVRCCPPAAGRAVPTIPSRAAPPPATTSRRADRRRSFSLRPTCEVSLISTCRDRVHTGSAPSGDVAGEHSYSAEEQRYSDERDSVSRADSIQHP